MNYRFKELTPQQNDECENYISRWIDFYNLYRLSETKVVCLLKSKDDLETDLTRTCFFGCELKEKPDYFSALKIIDLEDNEVEVLI